MIRKSKGKYVLLSKDGSRVLGVFDTKKQAEERETKILRIKRIKGK